MDTKKKFPVGCPACESQLRVSKFRCDACGTEVEGTFPLPVLARLNEKDQEFILDFVKSGGSLKEMAKKMELSYPTVRNRLDDLIEKLSKMH